MSRPRHSLRVRLVQPCERGGKLMAQRYQQRTPAMAAGKTNRRWTTVLTLLEQEAIERSSMRVRQKQQKEEELAEQAQEVMQQLSAQGRPVTQKAVAESLGNA